MLVGELHKPGKQRVSVILGKVTTFADIERRADLAYDKSDRNRSIERVLLGLSTRTFLDIYPPKDVIKSLKKGKTDKLISYLEVFYRMPPTNEKAKICRLNTVDEYTMLSIKDSIYMPKKKEKLSMSANFVLIDWEFK